MFLKKDCSEAKAKWETSQEISIFKQQKIVEIREFFSLLPSFVHRDLKPANILIQADRAVDWESGIIVLLSVF